MDSVEKKIRDYAYKYNNQKYFEADPIIIPRFFFEQYKKGISSLQDVEISGILSAHLAWGRRDLIVKDCKKMISEMGYEPYKYILSGEYRNDDTSLHRTIKWLEFAAICKNLKRIYLEHDSMETLSVTEIRTQVFGQKPNPKAPNKKIQMFRRWMVRDDGIVDFGIWTKTSPQDLIIPLDVHVHRTALELGITKRCSADMVTAMEITEFLKRLFPTDPCLGDFALFAYGADLFKKKSKNSD